MTSIEASREGKRDKRVEREKEKIESIRQDEGSGREHTIVVGVQIRKRMDKDQVVLVATVGRFQFCSDTQLFV